MASCCWAVSAMEQAPAATVRGAVAKANCTGGPALKVTGCTALIKPIACAVSIALPAVGSVK